MRKCLVVLLVLGAVSVSQAVMLADFETGFDGFRATGPSDSASTLSLSTKEGAVTSGSQCLKVDHKPNYWPLQWVAPSIPARLGKLSIDITCFADEWPAQPWTRFCEKIALQSDGLGGTGGTWAEYTTTEANWIDRKTGASAAVDWGAWSGDMYRTVVIDISDYDLTGATYFQINFSFNCPEGAGPYYLDNIHFVDEPANPYPPNNGVAILGYDTELSWENATDSLSWVRVWFGTAPKPGETDPNKILTLETYKNLLDLIYFEEDPGAASSCPMPPLSDGVQYVWVVDSDPNTYPIPFWTFTASANVPPKANAGPDQYLWLDGNASVAATLDGSGSTDDGQPGPLSYLWEQTAGPEVLIEDANSVIATVTLSELANQTEEGAAAPYVFLLTVSDGQFFSSDSVKVTLNSDSCRATIEAGGYYFYGDVTGPAGDGIRDCKVDMYDLAEVALNWLNCSNIFEPCD